MLDLERIIAVRMLRAEFGDRRAAARGWSLLWRLVHGLGRRIRAARLDRHVRRWRAAGSTT